METCKVSCPPSFNHCDACPGGPRIRPANFSDWTATVRWKGRTRVGTRRKQETLDRTSEWMREDVRSQDQADGDAPGAAQPRALGFWTLSLHNR